MAGPKHLSAATVKAIFKSKEPARDLAARYKVSQNLVYLIWDRKIHKGVTEAIRKPIRKRGTRASSGSGRPTAPRLDVNRLAERVADLVLKGFAKRLRSQG